MCIPTPYVTPRRPDQIALLGLASKRNRETIGGAPILLVRELLREIIVEFRAHPVASSAVAEDKPLLRTLQFITDHSEFIFDSGASA